MSSGPRRHVRASGGLRCVVPPAKAEQLPPGHLFGFSVPWRRCCFGKDPGGISLSGSSNEGPNESSGTDSSTCQPSSVPGDFTVGSDSSRESGQCHSQLATMRERITFVQKLGDSLEPSAVKVGDDTISGPEVHAVREDRLTIALNELPAELQTLLKGTNELHIRWVSPATHEAVSPLLARLPPGFHMLYTPGREDDVVS